MSSDKQVVLSKATESPGLIPGMMAKTHKLELTTRDGTIYQGYGGTPGEATRKAYDALHQDEY